jgi:hypothetical protein
MRVHFQPDAERIRVAHASRVLVSASRRNSLSLCSVCSPRNAREKVGDREDAFANTRDACATLHDRALGYAKPATMLIDI